MNKGMIMEVKRNYAIALNDEGLMEKIISKQSMEVGQKIFYFENDIVKTTANKAHRYNNFIKSFGSIAALLLLVFTFFNTMKYEQAYAVVSLDINPSIQIEADSNKQIIKVEGVNTDGKNIDFSDIKDISLDNGIEKIKEKLVEKNYLDTNKEVLVGYAFIKNGDNSEYVDTLKDAIESNFSTEKVTYVKEGDKKAVDEAKSKGISLGRYEASLVVDEETKNKIDKVPVKEITANIKDKENVSQWSAADEKTNTNIDTEPVINTNSEVKNETKSETPVSESPKVNIPTGKDDYSNIKNNTDTENGKDNNTKSEEKGVLEVEPEVPPIQSGKNDTSTPPKDNGISIAPENGASQNSITSGKIQEDANKTSKTEETVINKDTKK